MPNVRVTVQITVTTGVKVRVKVKVKVRVHDSKAGPNQGREGFRLEGSIDPDDFAPLLGL